MSPSKSINFIFCCFFALLSFNVSAAGTDLVITGDLEGGSVTSGNATTLHYTLTNNSVDTNALAIAFSTLLPSGVTVSQQHNFSTTCAAGITDITANATSVLFSGYTLNFGASCEIEFDVVATSVIDQSFNITTDGFESSLGLSSDISNTLNVTVSTITATLAVQESAVPFQETTNLVLTLTNNDAGFAHGFAGGITLPSGLTFSEDDITTNNCGDYFTATKSGSDTVNLSSFVFNNAIVAFVNGNSDQCTITMNVEGTLPGDYSISTDLLTYNGATLTIGKASTELVVNPIGFVNASFSPKTVQSGSVTSLDIEMTNFDRDNQAANVTFTTDLSAALSGMVANGLPLTDICGSGSTLSGTNVVTLSSGTIEAGQKCNFSIPVSVPNNASNGTVQNTITSISSSLQNYDDVSSNLIISNAPVLTMEIVESSFKAGDSITLRYSLENIDTVNAASNIAFDSFIGSPSLSTITTLPAANYCQGSGTSNQLVDLDLWSVAYSGVYLPAGGSCSFDLILTLNSSAVAGQYNYYSQAISASINGQNVVSGSTSASVSFSLDSAPSFSMSLADSSVLPGEPTSLDFKLSHSSNNSALAENIAFTVDLDAAASGFVSTGLPLTNVCGATSSISGTGLLTFSGGSLGVGESCEFSVPVQIPVAGVGAVTVTSSDLAADVNSVSLSKPAVSTNFNISGLRISRTISPSSIRLDGSSKTVQMTYLVTNQAGAGNATAGAITDSISSFIPSAQSVSGALSGFCGASSSASGTTFLIVTGLEIPEGGQCSFAIDIQVPGGTAPSSYLSAPVSLSATVNAISQAVTSNTVELTVSQLTTNTSIDVSSPTSESVVNVSISFSSPVTGFDASDVVLINATKGSFTGSESNYYLEVLPTLDGDVTIQIPAGVALDAEDANIGNLAATDIVFSYQSAPLIPTPSISLSAPSAILTSSNIVTYSVNYTDVEQVNLTTANVSLNTTGNAYASINVLNGDTSSATIELSNFTGNGTIGLNIAEGTARYSTNVAPAVGPSDVFAVDTLAPSVALSTASNSVNSDFIVDIQFSEDVSGFDVSDITVSNASLSNFQTIDAKNYQVTVSASGDVSISLAVPADKSTDAAGNNNLTSNSLNIDFDALKPTVSITGPGGTVASPFTVQIDFSEDISGFDISDISTINAGLSSFTQLSNSSYTVLVTPIIQSSVSLDIVADVAVDGFSNGNEAAATYSVLYDFNDAPVISGSPATSVNEDSAYSFTPS
ncbi:beta strand repeat-containing protein, partial [Shewanella maritima]|uniref:beta strand repeat-containing protein n=1 Tax=Shewanella maritima TaxID=2520507 RepID=UPI003736D670